MPANFRFTVLPFYRLTMEMECICVHHNVVAYSRRTTNTFMMMYETTAGFYDLLHAATLSRQIQAVKQYTG